jgi:hypothetical protein
MGVACRTHDFGAPHQVTVVLGGPHVAGVGRRVKARPAAAGIELGIRLEQQRAAANAAILPSPLVVPILAGKRSLGAFLSRDAVLLGCKNGLPFLVRLPDLVHHEGISVGSDIDRISLLQRHRRRGGQMPYG